MDWQLFAAGQELGAHDPSPKHSLEAISGGKRKATPRSAIEPSCREKLVGRIAAIARPENRRLYVSIMTATLHRELDISYDLTIANVWALSRAEQRQPLAPGTGALAARLYHGSNGLDCLVSTGLLA